MAQIHQAGLIGKPLVIKAQRHSTPSKPGTRRAGGSGRRRRFPGWYNDVKLSGDLIVENAVHNLDVCNWACRQPSGKLLWTWQEVSARADAGRHGDDGWHQCRVHLSE